jgi:hypothetical protein
MRAKISSVGFKMPKVWDDSTRTKSDSVGEPEPRGPGEVSH